MVLEIPRNEPQTGLQVKANRVRELIEKGKAKEK
jgi:hypothetical protein